MTTRPFVHLHCHSHYSLLDGASPVSKLVARAKQHGMNALALTDHGNLHGALEFYKKAKDAESIRLLVTKPTWHPAVALRAVMHPAAKMRPIT